MSKMLGGQISMKSVVVLKKCDFDFSGLLEFLFPKRKNKIRT